MATILLSAAGAAIGGSVGGTLAGLSSVAVGRAVGATLGQVIDQRLLGAGSERVDVGKVDRFRLTQAGEGAAIPQVYGRMRVGGQVIWASDFQEVATVHGGGKGSPPAPSTTQYSYSVSLAVAVCEGTISSVGRVWADGEEVAPADLNMRVYKGDVDQLPDPLIEAIESEGAVPAYRGTAYVVMEDLDLSRFGNRVPQFSFEVVRQQQAGSSDFDLDAPQSIRGVALMPGTGEYALATTPVTYSDGPGSNWSANVHAPSGLTDFETSSGFLTDELPGCDAVSLVVSWFGNDLRCGQCSVKPKVERKTIEGTNMPWSVAGLTRATADEIALQDGRPVYGGTPTDASVIEAIRLQAAQGRRVMFYPFILMGQMAGNGLPDPWSDADDQPVLPWRGRITLSRTVGQAGSPDGTAVAETEVQAFFGTAQAADFSVGDGTVSYSGPDEWGLRRFILHYAALCKAAGGVHAFCIGSEMRSLTQIRGVSGFPAVEAFRQLAAEVRAILGDDVRLGYAADWSEYWGYAPKDQSGDRYFHLDPLWADDNIDFVGIDNYMPISDWRDGEDHADRRAGWQSIHDLGYLRSNIEGGEGFDWFYASPEAREAQIRTDIRDGAHGEDWIWRYKDVRSWWGNAHHERIDGQRQDVSTPWIPGSKPIWFTELGCAAVDKGTNQPNKFLDQKSSESSLPRFSSGARDDLIQMQYLRAMLGHWSEGENNPVSDVYGGPMVDLSNAYVWAWDSRPFPVFPNNRDLWSDGENHARGHWLNGRIGSRTLASVVEEICARSGVEAIDVSALKGVVRGFVVDQVSDARSALQSLMLRHGFDAIERDGKLVFQPRGDRQVVDLDPAFLADSGELQSTVEHTRDPDVEISGRVRLRFVEAGGDHEVVSEEAVLPNDTTHAVAQNELPMSLTRSEGRQTVERWLSEARVSRDTVRFALPPSSMSVGAGDVVSLSGGDAKEPPATYRIDRVEHANELLAEAVRIEPSVYNAKPIDEILPSSTGFVAPVPVLPIFMDLPLITGEEHPVAPHLAVAAKPWSGSVAVYDSSLDQDYRLNTLLTAQSTIGLTESVLRSARTGLWDRGPAVQVKLISGQLQSRPEAALLSGANLAAIGDGSTGNWEVFQFANAELIAEDTYLLSGRLRGQLGTIHLMPAAWPIGATFVLLDGAPDQIELTAQLRRVARNYRIGPSRRAYSDPSFVHVTEAFEGNGLRPYSPCHLRAERQGSGAVQIRWIRRTRIDGDGWDGPDVPLGEDVEAYEIRVMDGQNLLHQASVNNPEWHYPTVQQTADGVTGQTEIHVAQVSARYGPGGFAKVGMPA